MIRLIIFDLDGLLVDTEPLHYRAYREAFSRFAFDLSEAEFVEHWTQQGRDVEEFITQRNLDIDPLTLIRQKEHIYSRLIRIPVQPMPGAVSLLQQLWGKKDLALATCSRRQDAWSILRTLGLMKYFEAVASKEDVSRLKPDPQILLHVAKCLSAESCECLVIDDAEKGIVAAYAARMLSIAVPNLHTRKDDFSKATMILPSLQEVSLRLIDELGGRDSLQL